MCGVNEAVKTILIYKANLIKNKDGLEQHIRSILTEHNIISSESSEGTVNNLVKVFKMGIIDGMVYDVGSALALAGKDNVENWTSRDKRRDIIREKFLEE